MSEIIRVQITNGVVDFDTHNVYYIHTREYVVAKSGILTWSIFHPNFSFEGSDAPYLIQNRTGVIAPRDFSGDSTLFQTPVQAGDILSLAGLPTSRGQERIELVPFESKEDIKPVKSPALEALCDHFSYTSYIQECLPPKETEDERLTRIVKAAVKEAMAELKFSVTTGSDY